MKALVTGAAGFIGSSIVKRLLADGYQVVGVDSITDYYDRDLKVANIKRNENSGFEFLERDLNDIDLSAALDDVQYVFHQAGQPGVRKSWGTDFDIYTRENVQATQRLLEAAKGSSTLKRLVYASSSSVYGNAERYPTTEIDRPQPVSPYGVTKLAAEHLCSLYASNFGVPTTSLRYFTVYGPRQRPDMAFTRFLKAAELGEELPLYGTGGQIRDFTFIDDVVTANVLAATTETVPGAVYNVAGGSNVSMNDVLDIIEGLVESPLRVNRTSAVAGDVWRTGGSTERIASDLSWSPTVSIEDGIAAQLEWVKSTLR
ncbi:NAD-dependent epimerase/dehydratase family protein [Arthrobacter sp. 24S4-2]|uniref:NAD-dependent epimerase/dehydratase family protein n=1 Tax=Arthrobacter sp. 24S4-2 TaxID=2575374 RepID=UPI0010C7993A|nr:NAD-dependent epimerase/dehydratase family protein [Arthrobacter sp. 24S4-2]QCO99594.1 NAD-dependent epimerase/dehydratase family protein [Arthrobacter sp. 24S4-2]